MDLSRLQEQSTRYLQSLLALGYLDRGEFRPQRPSYAPLVFRANTSSSSTTAQTLCWGAATESDFPTVVAMVDNILLSAARIGVLRIRSVLGYVRVCANLAQKQGCLRYMKMSRFELKARSHSFNIIKELETSILQLGGAIRFAWQKR